MGAFSILLADGHPVFRLGLRSVLGSHENWKICGEAADGQDAIEKCIHVKPDLILLEICLPRLNGVDGVRQILKHNPAQRILILTNVDSEKVVRDCLQAGVCGWVLKSDGVDDLTAAVEALQEPNYVGVKTPAMLVDGRWKGNQGLSPLETPQLSPREREVLQCLAEGRRLKEVAANLNISVKTADTHRTNIMSKLNLHSTSRLVIYALRNEIFQMPFDSVASPPEPAGSFSQ